MYIKDFLNDIRFDAYMNMPFSSAKKFLEYILETEQEKAKKEQIKLKKESSIINVFGSHSWNLDLKKESEFLYDFSKAYKRIAKHNISPNDFIITILALYQFGQNQKSYFKLPNRYLTHINQLNRSKTNLIINLAHKLNLIKIDRHHKTIYVKLNKEIFENDYYFQNILKSNKMQQLECRLKQFIKTDGMFYFSIYSNKIMKKQWKTIIIGISLIYTELINEFLMPEKQKEDRRYYGERKDITYLEIPVIIIAKILHIQPKRLIQYIHNYISGATYISKHDKVYTKKIEDSYYNADYKDKIRCDLKKYNEVVCEDKLRVTAFSTILYNQFYNTKLWNEEISPNIEQLKDLLYWQLKDLNPEDYSTNEYLEYIENDNIRKKIFKSEKDLELDEYSFKEDDFSNIDRSISYTKIQETECNTWIQKLGKEDLNKDSFFQPTKCISQASKDFVKQNIRSIPTKNIKVIKAIKNIKYLFNYINTEQTINDKEYNYCYKKIDKLINWINKVYNKCKIANKQYIKHLLEDYELQACLKNV